MQAHAMTVKATEHTWWRGKTSMLDVPWSIQFLYLHFRTRCSNSNQVIDGASAFRQRSVNFDRTSIKKAFHNSINSERNVHLESRFITLAHTFLTGQDPSTLEELTSEKTSLQVLGRTCYIYSRWFNGWMVDGKRPEAEHSKISAGVLSRLTSKATLPRHLRTKGEGWDNALGGTSSMLCSRSSYVALLIWCFAETFVPRP